jgi:hypothetical protein
VSTVAVTIPPTIGAAIRFNTSAPVPAPERMGASPPITAVTVIITGRSRCTAPSSTAPATSPELRNSPASFTPQRTVRGVIVTKVTVETKPWVLEALRAGLTEHYRGLKPTDAPTGAAAIKSHVGELPAFMAQQVDRGVARALVAYREFYK